MRTLLACLVLSTLLASCDAQPPVGGEIVARVNGHVVPARRLRQLQQWATDRSAGMGRDALLRSLVDRELMAQRAAELSLDRTPAVRAALDEVRSEALAQAYLDSLLPAQPVDGPEVQDFYFANPQLFRARERFQILELAATVGDERLPALRLRVGGSAGIADVAAWLDAQGIPYRAGGATGTSDTLAPELLTAVAAMRDGGMAVIAGAGRASVVQLLRREPAPLSLDQARAPIAALLRERLRADVARREAGELRARASVQTIAFHADPEKP